ncbi:MAG TPA: RagB/SusD family nutrient uptake outer membrane protein [Saprospiraceae bacterium]|nr:RagB/SusD family nutrient uptake outer membrane protein [Saprospiraceae bacterium]
MKNTANKFLIALNIFMVLNLFLSACKDSFLDVPPTSSLTEEVLATEKGVEGLLVGAYAMLNGRFDWYAGSSNWVHGSILGGDANKGTNAGDQSQVNPVERFETLPTNATVSSKWNGTFEGISRANATLRVLAASEDPNLTAEDRARISGEARFLRGHYYFELKRLFNNVPFIDETLTTEEAVKVPNTADIWPNIEADFKYAFDNLPETQGALGRANKWAAGAYLGKTYLYQGKYAEAKAMFDQVIANGKTAGGLKYGLLPSYASAFDAELDNSEESVFAIQAAANTGSTANADYEFVLNFPYNTGPSGPGNCCGFFQPSFELANSFRTDANGLPLLDGSYNSAANALKTDQGVPSADASYTTDAGPLDPRIDHSIGRRGIPYLDWQDHPGADWIRDQGYAGPYSPKKFIYYKSQEGTLTDGSGWTRGYAAMNYNIIRFADVLLMAAECEVELNNLEAARALVNQVRARAANPASWVKRSDGSNAANYVIGLYNTPWTSAATARDAVRFERKLELSGEGHRFFDLVRWGIASEAINAYLQYEGAILTVQLGGATFQAGKHERYPIPQTQIDRQGTDVLKQNPGYN